LVNWFFVIRLQILASATPASAGLAAINANLRSSLSRRHHADTGLAAFVISLTLLAALKVKKKRSATALKRGLLRLRLRLQLGFALGGLEFFSAEFPVCEKSLSSSSSEC